VKTNHQRGFVEEKRPDKGFSQGVKLTLSDRIVGAGSTPPSWDHTNGKRGAAKDRKGAKKFIRTRTRFHENAALRKLAKEESE